MESLRSGCGNDRNVAKNGQSYTWPTRSGTVRIIPCFEDAEVIEKILTHLDAKTAESEASRRPSCRAAPQRKLFNQGDDPTMILLGL